MQLVYNNIDKIAVVCSAGIGASAMGAAVLKKIAEQYQVEIEVCAVAVNNLTCEYDLIITHRGFESAVVAKNLDCQIRYIDNYLNKKIFEEIVIGIRDVK